LKYEEGGSSEQLVVVARRGAGVDGDPRDIQRLDPERYRSLLRQGVSSKMRTGQRPRPRLIPVKERETMRNDG
jgi:hypothetical protein